MHSMGCFLADHRLCSYLPHNAGFGHWFMLTSVDITYIQIQSISTMLSSLGPCYTLDLSCTVNDYMSSYSLAAFDFHLRRLVLLRLVVQWTRDSSANDTVSI